LLSGETKAVNIMGIDPAKLNIIYGVNDMEEAIEEGSSQIGGLGFIIGGHVWKNFRTGEKLHESGEEILLKVYTSFGEKEISGIVVGLAKARQSGFVGVNPDTSIIMDINTYFSLIDSSRNYRILYVLAKSPKDTDRITDSIRALLPRARTFNPSFIIEQFNKFIGSLQLYLGMVSGISMFIIGLWIFDTMTINVLQRTKEIGIMKAIGFRKRDILLLFLSETILTTLIGVSIGIILSIILAPYVKLKMMFSATIFPIITPDIIFIAVLLPFISNIFAAYIPARRAANLDPLGALRYE
ncbi:MAG TPA: FtsX-like permease family protein, partial [Thermoprotei archaeon]|nr:FtsX-like permease family protein [Thermoprotei archaeon]